MPPAQKPSQKKNRWAVILAGGDGVRLRPLTRRIAGDERPKQVLAKLAIAKLGIRIRIGATNMPLLN